MVVYPLLHLLPLLLLPVMIFLCTTGDKKRDQSSSTAQLRSSPMPRAKEVAVAPSEKQQSSKQAKQIENKEKTVESKKEQEKKKENEKKEEKDKEAKTQGDEFKFVMMKEDESQSIHTDLGSLKEDDNPLRDKNVQERIKKKQSEVLTNKMRNGSLKINASKTKLNPPQNPQIPQDPQNPQKPQNPQISQNPQNLQNPQNPQKSQMVMATQSDPTVKMPVIVLDVPKQEPPKPSVPTKNPDMVTAEHVDNGLKKQSSLVKGKPAKSGANLSVMMPSHFVTDAATKSVDKEEFCMDNKSKEPVELPKKEKKMEQTLTKGKNGSQMFPAPP